MGQALAAALKTPQMAAGRTPAPAWLQNASPQGVSTPADELDYLPLTNFDFTNGGAGVVDTDGVLDSFPQRPFRGERIVLQAVYITAAGVTRDGLFQVTINPAVYVGAVQVGATQGNMPAGAFAPNAFGVRLSFPSCGQGTRLYIPISIVGVGAGDRIIVSGGIFGSAVR